MVHENYRSGIYLIRNKLNGKVYVGMSTNIESRFSSHINTLNKGEHYSEHLQRSWNEYGSHNFDFFRIENCDLKTVEETRMREVYWIKHFESYKPDKGYNMLKLGTKLGSKGVSQKDIKRTAKAELDLEKSKEMPEIITKYKKLKLKIENFEYELLYEICQYKKLKKQDKKYIANLKKQGKEIRYFNKSNIPNKIHSTKYIEYAKKVIPFEIRVKRIEKILDKSFFEDSMTLREKIESKWFEINCHKLTSTALTDSNSIILDIMATYLLAGSEEESGILTIGDMDLIKKKETLCENACQLVEDIEVGENTWNIESADIIQFEKMEVHRRKREKVKRKKVWHNSPNYKLNALFSYDNHKTGQENIIYHIKVDRLINPEKPYLWEWAIVDTENEFEFKGESLKIDDSVKQYIVKKDNECEMDRIFVIEQAGERYYFDQKLDIVENSKIKKNE